MLLFATWNGGLKVAQSSERNKNKNQPIDSFARATPAGSVFPIDYTIGNFLYYANHNQTGRPARPGTAALACARKGRGEPMSDAMIHNVLPETAAPFLQGREIILAVMTLGAGSFCEETETLGTVYRTAGDWLNVHDGEHVARLIRFDLDALHGEDITETVANAWLDRFDQTPEAADTLPAFVRTSDAWDRWCADFDAEPAAYGRASHGTLNHRQQFGTQL